MSRATCPQFSELDSELIQDFYGSFQEAVDEVNACREALATQADDNELLNRLFRAVHSLKGNCNMMFLPPFVDVTHKLEEIFDDVRKARYPYDPSFGLFAQAVLTDVDEQLRALIAHKSFDGDVLAKIGQLISPLRHADNESERVQRVRDATTAILDRHYRLDLINSTAPKRSETMSSATTMNSENIAYDLEFMSEIGSALEARNSEWRSRIARQLELVKFLNKEFGDPVVDVQLTAAVFVHDMAMPWLSSAAPKPWSQMTADEQRMAAIHVSWAVGIVQRWPGWAAAAQIIEQHHEAHDGSGFPCGLKGEAITMGARFIALADVFFDAIIARRDQAYKACLLGAVKEVNAQGGRLLAPDVVEKFNGVIRQHYLAHPRW